MSCINFPFFVESGHPKDLLGRKFLQKELKIIPPHNSDMYVDVLDTYVVQSELFTKAAICADSLFISTCFNCGQMCIQ